MLELHQRVHPKHTVVGWFSTGMAAGIADGIIHKFYSTGQQSGCGIPVPMYLVVDTSLSQSDRVSIKAYVCKNLTFGSGPIGREFVEVPTQIQTSGGEGMALSALASEKLDSIPNDVQNFRQSFSKLQSLIAQAHAYVKEVVDGNSPPDVTIGRCVYLNSGTCDSQISRCLTAWTLGLALSFVAPSFVGCCVHSCRFSDKPTCKPEHV